MNAKVHFGHMTDLRARGAEQSDVDSRNDPMDQMVYKALGYANRKARGGEIIETSEPAFGDGFECSIRPTDRSGVNA